MSLEEKVKKVRTNSTGWKVQRIARRLDDEMNARLAHHGLNVQQFAVLMTVLERDGQTQSEIGAQFGMPPYAISRALDFLENSNLVERKPHPTSRRALTIHSTVHAKALLPSLIAVTDEVNANLTAPLSNQEAEVLSDLLGRIMR